MQTLLFLIYINDSTNRIESICKIFSMEVLFNPDPSKQAIEVCFPIKVTMKIILHQCCQGTRYQPEIFRILDSKLNFNQCKQNEIKKYHKIVVRMKIERTLSTIFVIKTPCYNCCSVSPMQFIFMTIKRVSLNIFPWIQSSLNLETKG